MSFIGLLMIANENDILAEVLASHETLVDAFYALDGTVEADATESRRICLASPKCAGYLTDAELPRPRFPEKPVCGYRQALYEAAVAEHGYYDNHFLILHGDELWTQHPSELVNGACAYRFRLPFYFPREPWDDAKSPLEQLRWSLGPGFPEWRMFKGSSQARYDERQTYNTLPQGLTGAACDAAAPIKHYLYRSPEAQRARAAQHVASGFDPDNYRHILDDDAVYWTDEMIAAYQRKPHFAELRCDEIAVAT